ncbi:MAG: cytochrome c [Xanthomonadales bacterium]|nr:cytochrome c [Xanthomonadales bacterium]
MCTDNRRRLLFVILCSVLACASPPALAASTSEAVQRGAYFANAIVDCASCHTKRDDKTDHALTKGPLWAGGEILGEAWAMPGNIVTPNLTPDPETGIGSWTDAELANAIRNGVNRQGERLFPLMPSHFYQRMADEDLADLIAYLRSLEPTKKPTDQITQLAMPRSELPPLPPVTGPVLPPASDPIARGEYIVLMANCITCHSPTQQGQPIQGKFLAVGVYFKTPYGSFPTPNITPDKKTGIGDYTDAELDRVMRTGIKKNGTRVVANFMPWYIYKNMTDEDMAAVIAYLRSLKPVENDIRDPANHHPVGG